MNEVSWVLCDMNEVHEFCYMNEVDEQGFLRRFMSSKRPHKFPVQTHKIGTSTLNLDNHEKF